MNRRCLLFHAIILATLVLARPTVASDRAVSGDGDVVFRAMTDELDRSMKQLTLAEMASPYFLSYQIRDTSSTQIRARYGAVDIVESRNERDLSLELRVGSAEQDNTNYVGTWRDFYRMRRGLPEEDDYQALRHLLWLYTDSAYKQALEDLARKRAYLQTHPEPEPLPDFAPAEPFTHLTQPLPVAAEAELWQREVGAAAKALGHFVGLQDWRVSYDLSVIDRRYLNSEGTRYRKGTSVASLEISATGQAADGQRLTVFSEYTARTPDQLPTGQALIRAAEELGQKLELLLVAPVLDEYAGPVLFSGPAAAQLISELFVKQLAPIRASLLAEEWMNEYLAVGKFARRIRRPIFPDFVTIVDDPGLDHWHDQQLVAAQVVDDEGVPSEKVTLVSGGRLITLPSCRRPSKKISRSNGHARTLFNQRNIGAITNLVVSTSDPLDGQQMLRRLRELCRDYEMEYGLLISLLDNSAISGAYRWSEGESDRLKVLSAPVLMYRVWALDGRIEPVRGLVFDEVTIRTLRDIVAMGGEEQVSNLWQSTPLRGLGYVAAIVVPEILVEEMEFESLSDHEPMLLSPRPMLSLAGGTP